MMRYLRASTVPYLTAITVGLFLTTYLHHLWQYLEIGIPVLWGQAVLIWGSWAAAFLALGLWALVPWQPIRNRWGQAFFGVLIIGWLTRLLLMYVHGDAYNYSVWLYPAIVLMVGLKFPNANESRTAVLVLAWTATALLVWTRFAELSGITSMAPVPDWLLDFEISEYWLPLSGSLGPEGRWPGPLGGTAFTGMLGAFLLVLAVALHRRASWALGAVGALTLLLTSSRGAFAATAAGIGVAVLFSDWRVLRRINFRWRLIAATVGGLSTLAVLLRASPNLTGRTTFWPDFLALWQSEPILGVGASGYLEGTGWTQTAGSAHSFFIDELARNGLLGFAVLIATFATALALGALTARRGEGGPLALLVTLTVLGIANTPFTWLSPSVLWLFLIYPAIWAAALLNPDKPTSDRLGLDSRG